MKEKEKNSKVVVFQAKNGAIELRGDLSHETIWATQAQIAEIFAANRSVITKHVNNVFKDKELRPTSVCAKFAHTAADGKTYDVTFYSLDVVLAVGYRVNSVRAIQFRQWATKTLREYITRGYVLNPKIIKQHYAEFTAAIENIRHLLPAGSTIDHASVLELVSTFAQTWLSLDAYDKDILSSKGATKKSVAITAEQLIAALAEFKSVLVTKGEATEIFGRERAAGSIEGIIGNVMQSFGGRPVYGTVEERAAHLLYFMVKNHPFTDGNKRSGAYAFIWFLQRAGLLERSQITPPALTALTLFIAESDPQNKDRMVKLVVQVLQK